MEKALELTHAKDTKEWMTEVEHLHQLLEASRKSLSSSEIIALVDCCMDLLKDNNFRVSQGALQALASTAVLSGKHLKLHFNELVPTVVERLGDAKQQIWDAARRLLPTLMEALWLVEFSFCENLLSGNLSSSIFKQNYSLKVLDLSENQFGGEVLGVISNCRNLVILNLWGNLFSGKIPYEIGDITNLEALFLGNNSFSREIPESLLGLNRLAFLDLSRNNFGEEIQGIFGKFKLVKFLVLHANFYTGGIETSRILKLPNILRLDLSYNNFLVLLPENHFLSSNPSAKLSHLLELPKMPMAKYTCARHMWVKTNRFMPC